MSKKKKIIITIAVALVLLLVAGYVTVNAIQASEVNKDVQVGNKYLDEGRYEQAIVVFEKAISIDKKSVEARVGLSKAYVAVKKPQKAEQVLKDGIKYTPKKDVLYAQLASVYLGENKIEDAIKDLDQGYGKTNDSGLKKKLDEISGKISLSVELNPLQVNNKTKSKLVYKNDNGEEKVLSATWSLKESNLGDIKAGDDNIAIYTAKAAGTDTIIAKCGSIEKTSEIKVEDRVAASIEIISLSNNGKVGDSVEFSAIVKDQLGQEMDAQPKWELSGDIAKLASDQGKVNKIDYIKDGSGKVTASLADLKSSVDFTVEKRKFTIITITSGQGAVTRTPDLKEYTEGDTVKITAVPSQGWIFKGWQGDIKTSKNPVEITINSNKNIKAVFEITKYGVRTSTTGEGTIKRNDVKDLYNYNSNVTLTAIPSDGWQFDHWEGDSNSKNITINVLVNKDKNLRAVFVRKHYNIETSMQGNGSIDKNESTQNVYKLTAKEEEGWSFDHWEGDITGSTNPVVITATNDKKVKAVFINEASLLNITSEGLGSVDKKSKSNKQYELTAVPAEGWTFDHWEGSLTGNKTPVTVKADKQQDIKAVFKKIQYKLQVRSNGGGSVNIDGQKDFYSYGDEVKLTEVPQDGWEFDSWKGSIDSNLSTVVVVMNGDKDITANFKEKNISGKVVDGQDGKELTNTTLKLRAGNDNKSGDVITTSITNEVGSYSFYGVKPGLYTIEISKDNYVTSYENVEVVQGKLLLKDFSILPSIKDSNYRVKLSWGQLPNDLDLHAITPNNEEIFYGNESSEDGSIMLDVDRTTGFGPETITLSKQQAGAYKFKVYNFTGSPSITTSNAKLEVYKGNQLIKSYNVPTTGDGRTWNVFELDGDNIRDINSIN